MDYRKIIASRIHDLTGLDVSYISKLIEVPVQPKLGDFTLPCFKIAKELGVAPNIISIQLNEKIERNGFEKIERVGPYLNFYIDRTEFVGETLNRILMEKDIYGSSNSGKGRTVVVEYSSLSITELVYTSSFSKEAIGNSITRLLSFEGYNVIGINSINYNNKINAVINKLKEKGLLIESNGAKVVPLNKFNMPPCIIINSNGAYAYPASLLAAAIYSKDWYGFYKFIIFTEAPTAMIFDQLSATLKLLGCGWSDDYIHVNIGRIKFPELEIRFRDRNIFFEKLDLTSVIFTYLKNNRQCEVTLDWNKILNLQDETYPYIEHTYTVAKSILRHASIDYKYIDYYKLINSEEFKLVKLLADFNVIIISAIDKLEPSIVVKYIIDVAKTFNKFHSSKLEDSFLMAGKSKLVTATCQVIKICLYLIGIEIT